MQKDQKDGLGIREGEHIKKRSGQRPQGVRGDLFLRALGEGTEEGD